MSTLVAHEWLAEHGGSESVAEQILQSVPDPHLVCLWNDAPNRFGTQISETWLARTPLRRSKAAALPFFPAAWRSVSLSDAERVVVSSHALAHQLATRAANAGIPSYAYVHTPARYIWTPEFDHRGRNPAVRAAAKLFQAHDRRRSSSLVAYAANSDFVRKRIAQTWHQEATVIYPPVAVEEMQATAQWADTLDSADSSVLESLPDQFVLGASRLVAYKRLDLAMTVGEALDLPVVIAGGGPEELALRRFATGIKVPVHFTGRVTDSLLRALYQRAVLLAFLAVEDFGVMPVEAMALGTPVLVNELGGAPESIRIVGGGSSVRASASPAELRAAALQAIAADRDGMRRRSEYFSATSFRERIAEWVSP